jgi:hypothetical protein
MMTIVDEPALTETLDRSEQVALLKRQADAFQPRKFAIFGVYKEIDGVLPEEPFLGWGLDLGDDEGAVFWEPSSKDARCADSPHTILRSLRRMGEVHLISLESDEQPAPNIP